MDDQQICIIVSFDDFQFNTFVHFHVECLYYYVIVKCIILRRLTLCNSFIKANDIHSFALLDWFKCHLIIEGRTN